MTLKIKILIGILAIIIFVAGGWWFWYNIEQQKGVFRESTIPKFMKSCVKDSDCILTYSSCSCDAVNVNYKDNPDVLKAVEILGGGMECFSNHCILENIFAACKNNKCIKEKFFTTGNLEEYDGRLVQIKGTINKIPFPKMMEPDHYALCNFGNFTAYHYFDDSKDQSDCIPLFKVALSTPDVDEINKNVENLIPNPLNKKVEIIGRVFVYEVDPKTCHMASIGCQKWVGIIPIEIKEDFTLQTEEIKQKVTITTDKTKYGKDETVKITMINGMDQAVVPQPLGSDLSAFYGENYGLGFIEKFEKMKWVQIEPLWRCGNSCFAECLYEHSFEPAEKRVLEWNETRLICDKESRSEKSEKVESGKYRISALIVKEQLNSLIYSNEFIIE